MSTQKYVLPEACQDTPSMQAWLEADSATDQDAACKPCVLPVVTQWYLEELAETGRSEMAVALEQMTKAEDIDPLKLAQELDNIKERVDPNFRNRLRELDCSLQVNAAGIAEGLGEDNG